MEILEGSNRNNNFLIENNNLKIRGSSVIPDEGAGRMFGGVTDLRAAPALARSWSTANGARLAARRPPRGGSVAGLPPSSAAYSPLLQVGERLGLGQQCLASRRTAWEDRCSLCTQLALYYSNLIRKQIFSCFALVCSGGRISQPYSKNIT